MAVSSTGGGSSARTVVTRRFFVAGGFTIIGTGDTVPNVRTDDDSVKALVTDQSSDINRDGRPAFLIRSGEVLLQLLVLGEDERVDNRSSVHVFD